MRRHRPGDEVNRRSSRSEVSAPEPWFVCGFKIFDMQESDKLVNADDSSTTKARLSIEPREHPMMDGVSPFRTIPGKGDSARVVAFESPIRRRTLGDEPLEPEIRLGIHGGSAPRGRRADPIMNRAVA